MLSVLDIYEIYWSKSLQETGLHYKGVGGVQRNLEGWLLRVGIRQAVNTSEGEGTREKQFPDLEGVCHTGDGAFGGLGQPA